MGTDLSTLLIFIATAFGGNIESLTFSLGGEDDRTYSAAGIGSREAGRQLGLDGHSRCEGDISALRKDFYLNGGGRHHNAGVGCADYQTTTTPTLTDSSDISSSQSRTVGNSILPLLTLSTARTPRNPSTTMTSCSLTPTLSS